MAIRPKAPGKWIVDVYPAGGQGRRVRVVPEGTYDEALVVESHGASA
jgi:hypothetical protein